MVHTMLCRLVIFPSLENLNMTLKRTSVAFKTCICMTTSPKNKCVLLGQSFDKMLHDLPAGLQDAPLTSLSRLSSLASHVPLHT